MMIRFTPANAKMASFYPSRKNVGRKKSRRQTGKGANLLFNVRFPPLDVYGFKMNRPSERGLGGRTSEFGGLELSRNPGIIHHFGVILTSAQRMINV